MGLELDLTKVTDEDFDTFADAVARHKADRDLWHSGKFYRVRCVDEDLIGAAVVSRDQNSARLVMAQIDRPRSIVPPTIAIPGLDPDRLYRVSLQTPPEVARRASRTFDNPLMDDGMVLPGRILQSAGIQLPVMYAQTGVSLALEATR